MCMFVDVFFEDGILVNELIIVGGDVFGVFLFLDLMSYYGMRGGGIGQVFFGVFGVFFVYLGCFVVVLLGDGFVMYLVQVLWFVVYFKLLIVFVILYNCEYKIFKINMDIYCECFGVLVDCFYFYMDLMELEIDYVGMVCSMGVDVVCIDDLEEIDGVFCSVFVSGCFWFFDVFIEGRIVG